MSLFRRFLRRLNPLAAMGDLGQQLSTPYPHRYKIILASLAVTGGLFSVIWQEGGAGLPLPPKIPRSANSCKPDSDLHTHYQYGSQLART